MLQARFEDAQFFYNSDLKQSLEDFVPKLEGTQFHRDLGNLLQKTERVVQLIRPIAEACGLTGVHCLHSSAGLLCSTKYSKQLHGRLSHTHTDTEHVKPSACLARHLHTW